MTPRRSDILYALGIQAYAARSATSVAVQPPSAHVEPSAVANVASVPPAAEVVPPVAVRVAAPVSETVSSAAASARHVDDERGAAGPAASPAVAVEQLDWNALQAAVAECRLCGLCDTRKQTVFGSGDREADWLIVGEAPGAEEDLQGEPFVGRAGQLLNAMLSATGRPRGKVYIANILKCRPPSNRDPHVDEAAACMPYLDRQIALLQPRLILAVGRIAAQRLLGVDTPLGRLRGQIHSYGASNPVPLVATYHPAYLLRAPSHKRQAWEDLLFAQRVTASTLH